MTPSTPKERLSFKVPAYISRSIQLLEKVHPWLAARFALWIFFKPIPFKIPEREKAMAKKAKIYALQAGNAPFTGYRWPPKTKGAEEKQILLVHGWSGRATQFFKLVEALTAQGYTVYGIDAPAHGNAREKSTNMLAFVEAIEVMMQCFGAFDGVIGHSLGGMALFNAIDRFQVSKRIITVGTPASVPNVVQDFCEKVGASPEIGTRICQRIERVFHVKVEQISTDYLAAKHQPEGMVIHDEEDLDVSIAEAKEIATAWTKATPFYTKGLGHRRILMDKEVIKAVTHFLSRS